MNETSYLVGCPECVIIAECETKREAKILLSNHQVVNHNGENLGEVFFNSKPNIEDFLDKIESLNLSKIKSEREMNKYIVKETKFVSKYSKE